MRSFLLHDYCNFIFILMFLYVLLVCQKIFFKSFACFFIGCRDYLGFQAALVKTAPLETRSDDRYFCLIET